MKKNGPAPRSLGEGGFSLIEAIIGIGVVAMVVVAFAVSLMAAVYAERIRQRNVAAALADEQMAALRSGNTVGLTAVTNGPLVNLLMPQGAFTAVTDGSAPSLSHALNAATSTASGLTGVMPLPSDTYSDFTLTAKLKVNPGSPASWKAGLLFRASDLGNLYQVYLTSSSLVFQKVSGGGTTTLYTDSRSISTGTWQTLSVTAAGSSLAIVLNGVTVTTQTDATFSSGEAALAVWQGASVNFDDVTIGGQTWNFDATSVGSLDDDWLRFGLGDLTNGTGTLTVATPYNDTSFKKYTVTVSWTDRSGTGTKQVSQTTFKQN